MKVILLGELRGKGGEGDIVEVAQGYAENFLFPNKIAQPATPGNIKQLEERRHNIAKREEQRIADANATKAALDGKLVTVDARIGEEASSLALSPPLRLLMQSRHSSTSPLIVSALLVALLSRPLVATMSPLSFTVTSPLPSLFLLARTMLLLQRRRPRRLSLRQSPRLRLSPQSSFMHA